MLRLVVSVVVLVLGLLLVAQAWDARDGMVSNVSADEEVVLILGYGHLDRQANQWVVPIEAWVFEPEDDDLLRGVALEAFRRSLGIEDTNESVIFLERARPFLVDNERGKRVVVRSLGEDVALPATEADGRTAGAIRIGGDAPGAARGAWIDVEAVLDEADHREFSARARLAGASGIGVICDIDDTIKVSEVNDREALLEHTFLKEFEPVAGMAALLSDLEDRGATIHYVSTSPKQLIEPLRSFMSREGFPAGEMHLKPFRWKDERLLDLFAASAEHKNPVIESILAHWPERSFILIGDDGQDDASIYGEVARRHPGRVGAIGIRYVEAPDEAARAKLGASFGGVERSVWIGFETAEELRGHEAMAGLLDAQ